MGGLVGGDLAELVLVVRNRSSQECELAVSYDYFLERGANPTTYRVILPSRHGSLTGLHERRVDRHSEPLLFRCHT